MNEKHRNERPELEKQALKEKMARGSLWVCYKPNWYLYNYSDRPLRSSDRRPKSPRHIKFVHKTIIAAYQQEEALTPNHALFLTGFCAGIYEFTYCLETIRMRDEFVYKFVEEWTRV